MAQRLRRALEERGGERFFEGRLRGLDVVGGREADELLDLVDQLYGPEKAEELRAQMLVD